MVTKQKNATKNKKSSFFVCNKMREWNDQNSKMSFSGITNVNIKNVFLNKLLITSYQKYGNY